MPFEEYEKMQDRLYLEKVSGRIRQLKGHELYLLLARYDSAVCGREGLDGLAGRYADLYRRSSARMEGRTEPVSVIGHGNLCFSNMPYDRDTDILKLIDSKGPWKRGRCGRPRTMTWRSCPIRSAACTTFLQRVLPACDGSGPGIPAGGRF